MMLSCQLQDNEHSKTESETTFMNTIWVSDVIELIQGADTA